MFKANLHGLDISNPFVISKENVNKQINDVKQCQILMNEVQNRLRKVNKLLWKIPRGVTYWRNVDSRLLEIIKEQYDDSQILNCYGEIFIIIKQCNNENYLGWECARLNWDLNTDSEHCLIFAEPQSDSDGGFAYYEYSICDMDGNEINRR